MYLFNFWNRFTNGFYWLFQYYLHTCTYVHAVQINLYVGICILSSMY